MPSGGLRQGKNINRIECKINNTMSVSQKKCSSSGNGNMTPPTFFKPMTDNIQEFSTIKIGTLMNNQKKRAITKPFSNEFTASNGHCLGIFGNSSRDKENVKMKEFANNTPAVQRALTPNRTSSSKKYSEDSNDTIWKYDNLFNSLDRRDKIKLMNNISESSLISEHIKNEHGVAGRSSRLETGQFNMNGGTLIRGGTSKTGDIPGLSSNPSKDPAAYALNAYKYSREKFTPDSKIMKNLNSYIAARNKIKLLLKNKDDFNNVMLFKNPNHLDRDHNIILNNLQRKDDEDIAKLIITKTLL